MTDRVRRKCKLKRCTDTTFSEYCLLHWTAAMRKRTGPRPDPDFAYGYQARNVLPGTAWYCTVEFDPLDDEYVFKLLSKKDFDALDLYDPKPAKLAYVTAAEADAYGLENGYGWYYQVLNGGPVADELPFGPFSSIEEARYAVEAELHDQAGDE